MIMIRRNDVNVLRLLVVVMKNSSCLLCIFLSMLSFPAVASVIYLVPCPWYLIEALVGCRPIQVLHPNLFAPEHETSGQYISIVSIIFDGDIGCRPISRPNHRLHV